MAKGYIEKKQHLAYRKKPLTKYFLCFHLIMLIHSKAIMGDMRQFPKPFIACYQLQNNKLENTNMLNIKETQYLCLAQILYF